MAGNYNYPSSGGFNRDWMYKRFEEMTGNLSAEYVAGVEEFLTFANSQPIVQSCRGKFHCPCAVCKNKKHIVSGRKVSSHLFSQGFMPDYYVSYMHGEEQLGKTVSIGDVFIKTHTKPDGTYVDRKTEKIAELYQKNLQLRQSELEAEASTVSDGTSRARELTAEECTTIFLQSTERDSRGVPYGVGSLKESLVNGKQKQAGDSTSFVALQEQLLEAQRKIEEQVSYNQRREAENSRAADEQKKKLEHLSLVEKFLRKNDPRFLNFLESHSAKETTTYPISPSPAASPSSSAS